MFVRDEKTGDETVVREVIAEAFKPVPYSGQTEAAIYDALREAGAMIVSLVAEEDGEIVGHIAFSHVTIGDAGEGWLGVGPVAVRPDKQGRGVGRALVEAGLARARSLGVAGAVLVGEPAFYGRFGFAGRPGLTHEGVPDQFVMGISFGAETPRGMIRFHPAFAAE